MNPSDENSSRWDVGAFGVASDNVPWQWPTHRSELDESAAFDLVRLPSYAQPETIDHSHHQTDYFCAYIPEPVFQDPSWPVLVPNLAQNDSSDISSICGQFYLSSYGSADIFHKIEDSEERNKDYTPIESYRFNSRIQYPESSSIVTNLFPSLSTDSRLEPTDFKDDPTLQKRDPRWEGDLYTARWVRGDGAERAGWCGYCPSWHKLKDSAYWYHAHYTHVSSLSTVAFRKRAIL
jgi:hypothetical protein